MTPVLIAGYLTAIVAANLTTAQWGPEWSVYNAFLLVGLILSTRDKLHDLWGRNRFRNMAILIATGGGLSWVAAKLIVDAPPEVVSKVALASFTAFVVAEVVDTANYHVLRHREWLERANTSNVFAAALDSAIFVSIAFGWTWEIIFAQFCAKVAGGFIWSMVLKQRQMEQALA